MGSERSEAREQQLLQAIHDVNADAHHGNLDLKEAQKSEGGGRESGGGGGEEEEKRGVLQAVGELVSQSAQSVKDAILGKDGDHSKDGDQCNQESNHSSSTPRNQIADSQEESAQVSLLVHTIVHD